MSNMQFSLRKSEDRGQGDIGWFNTFHTFSFSSYRDPAHMQYGPLRVINEDRVIPKKIGSHPHSEFEIFSYIVTGSLKHTDSMGNTEVIKRGSIQLTSAGTGITHSEMAQGGEECHFLQIWSLPATPRLTPRYYTRNFTDAEKTDKWAKLVAPAWADGVTTVRDAESQPAPVQSQLTLYATILSEGKSLSRTLEGKKAYVHLIQTSGYNTGAATGAAVRLHNGTGSEVVLREGDGAYVKFDETGTGVSLETENIGDRAAHFLVFDLD